MVGAAVVVLLLPGAAAAVGHRSRGIQPRR
jgi:hypothetical protein